MNDVWIFNTDQRGWSCPEIKSDKPCAREMHSGTMVDATTMLVYGGRSSSGRWAEGTRFPGGGGGGGGGGGYNILARMTRLAQSLGNVPLVIRN